MTCRARSLWKRGGRVASLEIPEKVLVGEFGGARLGVPGSEPWEILGSATQQRELLLEVPGLVLPVLVRSEVWERRRERGIAPAPRDPGRVAHEAQRPKGLHQPEPAPVKAAELLVGVDQQRALPCAIAVTAREQHPHVLDRRADHEIIKIEKEPPLPAVKKISEVTISVDGVKGNALAPGLIQRSHPLRRGAVAARAARWEKAPLLQEGKGLAHKALGAERGPRLAVKRRADVVDPRQESPQDGDFIVGKLGGRASAGAWPDRVQDALD